MTHNASPSVEITLLPASAASDDALVREITDLVNRVYRDAEDGLWVDGATRTTATEMSEVIAAGQIAAARTQGQIVGSVRVQRLDSSS